MTAPSRRIRISVPLLAALGVLPGLCCRSVAGEFPEGSGVSLTSSGVEAGPGGGDLFQDGIGGALFPHLHLRGVAGGNDGPDGRSATAHHDPRYDGFNFSQGLEAGFSLRAGEHLEGFATGALTWDRESHDWDAELEEAFAKVRGLPGGFEVRAGRFLNRFGRQNSLHVHGYDFVDQNLINGVLLGEHGLAADGGELSWNIPLPFPSVISAGFGRAVTFDHDHGHDDHSPHGHHGGGGHDAHDPDPDGFALTGNLFTVRWLSRYQYNDFHRFSGGVSYARGENGFHRHTSVFGVDLEYLWRENGLEPGGRELRWNTGVFHRRAGIRYAGGHGHHGEFHRAGHDHDHDPEPSSLRGETVSGTGVMTSVVWSAGRWWDAGLRAEWLDGHRGQPERWRVSPAVTFRPDPGRHLLLRLQYNHDCTRGTGDDHAVWLQFGVDFGGREVR